MKCGECGKPIHKHDCQTGQECLELASLELVKANKENAFLKKENEKLKKK